MSEQENRSCPSLSGQSILTYNISCKGREVYFSLVENTLQGLFSKEPISLKKMLTKKGQSITAGYLNEIFKAKSINSGGFMLAVLKHEGLVQNIEGKRGSYISTDITAFTKAIKAPMESTPKKESL